MSTMNIDSIPLDRLLIELADRRMPTPMAPSSRKRLEAALRVSESAYAEATDLLLQEADARGVAVQINGLAPLTSEGIATRIKRAADGSAVEVTLYSVAKSAGSVFLGCVGLGLGIAGLAGGLVVISVAGVAVAGVELGITIFKSRCKETDEVRCRLFDAVGSVFLRRMEAGGDAETAWPTLGDVAVETGLVEEVVRQGLDVLDEKGMLRHEGETWRNVW